MDLRTIKRKTEEYKEIIQNTKNYRADWTATVIPQLQKILNQIIKESSLEAKVILKDAMENLNVVMLSLGQDISGIAEKIEDTEAKRQMIKNNGSLIFQQLFNGKILVMIMYPYIEGYGQPQPPKTLEILRPHELTDPFILRYVEEFLREIIEWEDYDDDGPKQGQITPIGFQSEIIQDME